MDGEGLPEIDQGATKVYKNSQKVETGKLSKHRNKHVIDPTYVATINEETNLLSSMILQYFRRVSIGTLEEEAKGKKEAGGRMIYTMLVKVMFVVVR